MILRLKPLVTASFLAILGLTFTTQHLKAAQPPAKPTTAPLKSADELPNFKLSSGDEALLRTTIANLAKGDRLQFESETRLVEGLLLGNTENSITAKSTTILEFPNKVRAEIVYQLPKQPPNKAILVSNGQQVWYYKANERQYTKTPYSEFSWRGNYIFWGVVGQWMINLTPQLRQAAQANTLTAAQLFQILDIKGKTITGAARPETVEGQPLQTYAFTVPDINIQAGFRIQPSAAQFKQIFVERIDPTTKKPIPLYFERIVQQTINPAIAADTFTFVPPAGAKQVEFFQNSPR